MRQFSSEQGGTQGAPSTGASPGALLAASDRALVETFVARHFRFRGTVRLHAHALGWDLLRAPANVILAPVFLLSRLAALALNAVRLRRAGRWLAGRRIFLQTAVARAVADALRRDLIAVRGPDSAVDGPVAERLIDDYCAIRGAIGEIVTLIVILAVGFAVFRVATPGLISLAPLVTEKATHAAAVSNFFWGERLGGVWYGMFPVDLPVWKLVGTGAVLAMAASLATTFAGLVADPIQTWTGLHRRRLMGLLKRFDAQTEANAVPAPEHLVARSADIFDALLNIWRFLRP